MTLIELLVVVGIIGILTALLLPAVQAARGVARKMSCQNNLRQLSLGLHHYHDAHQVLPCSSLDPEWISASGEWSWGSRLLPFMEQNALHEQCDFSLWPAEEANRPAIQTTLPVFRCPSEAAERLQACEVWDGYDWVAVTLPNDNYGLNEHLDEFAPGGTDCWRFADIKDGLSKTITVGETTAFVVSAEPDSELHWRFTWSSSISAREGNAVEHDFWATVDCTSITQPADQDWNYLSSYQSGGAHAALGDGSVRFIGQDIDEETLGRLADPNDGEVLGDF